MTIVMLGSMCRADAQTPSPLANWQFDAGEVLESLEVQPPKWDVTLGLGAVTLPKYEGAKQYKVWPSGILDVRYKDIAFLSDGEGIGVNLLHGKGYRAGVAISYDIGRHQSDDVQRLHGLGNIAVAPEAKAFVEYFVKAVVLTADVRKGLGGHNGVIGDLGAYVPIPVIKDKFFIFLGPDVTFANGRYMRSYFGVSAAQSEASHLPQYRTIGGMKNFGGGATFVYLMGDHWLVNVDSGYQRLVRSAAASPIVETRTEATVDLNVGYHF